MSESDPIHATLSQLHAQLAEAESLDADVAAELRETIDEIQAKLANTQEYADADDDSLSGRLNETAVHFEESHPVISGTLQRLVDMLAQMGI